IGSKDHTVKTRLHGTQLVTPVLCALGVAVAVGMPVLDAIKRIESTEPAQGRMQISTTDDGVIFIRDDWKAPQWSFGASIDFLKAATAQRKVVVLGTMSDSPKSPARRYAHAVRQALEAADLVVLVGVDG